MKRTIEAMQYGDRLDADPEGAEHTKLVRLAVTATNVFTAIFEDGMQITAPAGTKVVLSSQRSRQ